MVNCLNASVLLKEEITFLTSLLCCLVGHLGVLYNSLTFLGEFHGLVTFLHYMYFCVRHKILLAFLKHVFFVLLSFSFSSLKVTAFSFKMLL